MIIKFLYANAEKLTASNVTVGQLVTYDNDHAARDDFRNLFVVSQIETVDNNGQYLLKISHNAVYCKYMGEVWTKDDFGGQLGAIFVSPDQPMIAFNYL